MSDVPALTRSIENLVVVVFQVSTKSPSPAGRGAFCTHLKSYHYPYTWGLDQGMALDGACTAE